MKKLTLGRVLEHIFIYTLTFVLFLPVANIFISAFKTNQEIMRSTVFPAAVSLANFIKVLKKDVFYTGMLNSILITGCSLALSTILASLAAFPLSRGKKKIHIIIYFYFLAANMIPAVANMIPLYTMMRGLHLLNSRIGMILLYSSGLSMGILLFTSFFKTVPEDLLAAAEIDGCNYGQAFFKVILPIMKPVCVSYIMINVIGIWNDFLMPQLFLSSKAKQTITLAVYTFSNESGSDWGAIFALMAMSVILPMLLFICNQKYFFEGMSVGAVKG